MNIGETNMVALPMPLLESKDPNLKDIPFSYKFMFLDYLIQVPVNSAMNLSSFMFEEERTDRS